MAKVWRHLPCHGCCVTTSDGSSRCRHCACWCRSRATAPDHSGFSRKCDSALAPATRGAYRFGRWLSSMHPASTSNTRRLLNAFASWMKKSMICGRLRGKGGGVYVNPNLRSSMRLQGREVGRGNV
eukprot:350843-Chlamydomonas_euryale.AAC.7